MPVVSPSSAVFSIDHVLGDGDDAASARPRGADREVAVRRVADGERGDAGHGLDARDAAVVGERRGDRARPERLGGEHPRHRLGGEARLGHLGEALCQLREQRAAGRRADHRVRQLPAELLGDLEGDRLRALARIGVQVPADEAPGEEPAELELEAAAVVVRAGDREDARAGMARRHRCRLTADRREHDRLEPRRRGRSGDGMAEIAGRRAAERRHAVVEGRGSGDRRDAVLVGLCRVVALELQVQIEAEELREAVGTVQRRPAGAVTRPERPAGSRPP